MNGSVPYLESIPRYILTLSHIIKGRKKKKRKKKSRGHLRNSRHRKGQKPPVQLPQALNPKDIADLDGMRQVQAVGVKLGQGRRRHHDARRQAAKLDEVQGAQDGLAKGRRLAVVGRGMDGQQVDLRRGLGHGDGAARVAFTCRDGHRVERLVWWGCGCWCG